MIAAQRGNTLLIVLLVVVLMALAGLALLVVSIAGVSTLPGGDVVLELDLTHAYPEVPPESPFGLALTGKRATLREVLTAVRDAADDDRVVALVARVGAPPMGLATLQEFRDAVLDFREAGKKAIAHADTLGEFGPGNGAFYLASAFDEIHLQPSGDVGLTGVRYEVPFVRGALDKLGVVPAMDHRAEYKNAMNTYTETAFTEPHEEALRAIAESHLSQMVRGIAAGRGLEEEAVRALFDAGPYLGPEALELGLVDRLAYSDEVYDRLREELGDDVSFQKVERYAGARAPRFSLGGRTVALIYGVGGVVRGRSGYDPLSGSLTMGADTVAGAFRDAIEDDRIEAILFRVDSPGGSYVGSDTIWRETVRAREAGKPVVVSMGNLAGSGGYFVAMAADAIVAQPGTITGSIGVYAGKLVARDAWAKIGITWDAVSAGERADFWSGIENYSEPEWRRLQDSLDRIYEDFTSKVADGRKLPLEQVAEFARGRIWTGEDAQRLGLVDELGGYQTAFDTVRSALGAAPGERLELEVFPRPRSALELLRESNWLGAETVALAAAAPRLRPAIELARRLGLLEPAPGVLSMRWQPEAP